MRGLNLRHPKTMIRPLKWKNIDLFPFKTKSGVPILLESSEI